MIFGRKCNNHVYHNILGMGLFLLIFFQKCKAILTLGWWTKHMVNMGVLRFIYCINGWAGFCPSTIQIPTSCLPSSWWFRNLANQLLEVGSISHYLRRVLYIPGGDRQISEPSTLLIDQPVAAKPGPLAKAKKCVAPRGIRTSCPPISGARMRETTTITITKDNKRQQQQQQEEQEQ